MKKEPIYVVVVEDHHHVLEHIHYVLRRRKRLQPWTLLHLDAHPDLACSQSIPAVACYQPRREYQGKNLYDHLDSTSCGISEWILPLVLAGGLSQIHWVKPPESQQFPAGRQRFLVGVRSSKKTSRSSLQSFRDLEPSDVLRVDCHHPYYLDDDAAVPTQELSLSKTLDLLVSELSTESLEESTSHKSWRTDFFPKQQEWALDVCLDFFACLNPFLVDLEAECSDFASFLVRSVTATKWHIFASQLPEKQNDANDAQSYCFLSQEAHWYTTQLETFRTLLRRLLENPTSESDATIRDMMDLYISKQDAKQLLQSLVQCLSMSNNPSRLAAMAMECLSTITMPHNPKASTDEYRKSITKRMATTERLLLEMESGDPLFITIARSTTDGFTPGCIVEELQSNLLLMVHTRYCGCNILECAYHAKGLVTAESFPSDDSNASQCRFRVIFDYGKWSPSSFERRQLF